MGDRRVRLPLDPGVLIAAASVSFTEPAYGIWSTQDPLQEAVRQTRLKRLTAQLGPGLPFDHIAATAYGFLAGLSHAASRTLRARALDPMTAATACANDAAAVTLNPVDFAGLEPLVPIRTP